jgi:hypothetical protein
VPSIRQSVRRSGRLTALARGVRDAIRGVPANTKSPAAATSSAKPDGLDGVAELHRVVPKRAAASAGGPRLNLLVPTLSPARAFGGTRTALDLFEALAPRFPRLRVVAFQPIPEAASRASTGSSSRTPATSGSRIAPRSPYRAARAAEPQLAVGPDDAFLATFWTTAELAARLVRWQAAIFGGEPRPFTYLVQDFEPGFYPWSAQSELARATYASGAPTIAVINSGLLKAYLDEQGITFDDPLTFEPRIDAGLRPLLSEAPRERRRRIVVYGRPETPRNAFPLLVDGPSARGSRPAAEAAGRSCRPAGRTRRSSWAAGSGCGRSASSTSRRTGRCCANRRWACR